MAWSDTRKSADRGSEDPGGTQRSDRSLDSAQLSEYGASSLGSSEAEARSSRHRLRPRPERPGGGDLHRAGAGQRQVRDLRLLRARGDDPDFARRSGSSGRSARAGAAAASASCARRRRLRSSSYSPGGPGTARRCGRPGPCRAGATSKAGDVAPSRAKRASFCRVLLRRLLGVTPSGLVGGRHRVHVLRRRVHGTRPSSSASRAWVSLRSGSPAGRKRSSPHHRCTRVQSTAPRARGGRRPRPAC